MWLPNKAFDLFRISQDTVSSLREDLAKIKAERDSLRDSLTKSEILSDWLRIQVNSLQFERSALLDKAYGIKAPVPELMKKPEHRDPAEEEFSFEDIGDTLAKKLGLQVYDPSTVFEKH